MLNTSARRSLRRMGALALLFLAGLLPLTWATAKAATTGEQRTAVILVNFQDLATQPVTKAAAHTLVFGGVSDFYWEASYQKTFFSGDSFGWFTVPVSRGVCDIQLLAREADKAATAAGADLTAYDRVIYLAPDNACSGTGYNSGTARPTRTWIFSNAPDAGSIAHEVGHNFGLSHSQSLDCGAVSLASDCIVRSYGDPADTMGSGGDTHFNALQKDLLGWIGAAGTPGVTTVAASGRFQLTPFAAGGTASKALKIPRGIDALTGEMSYYYVEYRQRIGFDATLGGNLTQGVLVHVGGINQYSRLLDMTPGSDPVSDFNDMYDSALTVGRSYSDANAGIRISLVAADAAGATVDVSVGGSTTTCTRSQPTIAVSGPADAVLAGTALSYTIAVTNRDSAGCATTTFNLARSVPDGWAGALAAGSVSLSPGATASTTLTVTSPAGAAAGTYGVGVGTGSSAGSVHTANASLTYQVATSSTGATLTGSVGADKSSYARGETAYLSALVKRDGAVVSGASVTFLIALPDGTRTSSTAMTGADGFARITYRIGKGKPAIGGYAVRADMSSNGATTTATGAFSVK